MKKFMIIILGLSLIPNLKSNPSLNVTQQSSPDKLITAAKHYIKFCIAIECGQEKIATENFLKFDEISNDILQNIQTFNSESIPTVIKLIQNSRYYSYTINNKEILPIFLHKMLKIAALHKENLTNSNFHESRNELRAINTISKVDKGRPEFLLNLFIDDYIDYNHSKRDYFEGISITYAQ